MKKIVSCCLALMSIVAILTTCSGPEEITPPTGAGDTIITIEERMEVFEACKKKSAELNNLEGLEDRINFLAWLATQSAFFSYGFAGEDLYAVFQDGRVVLFVHTPLDEPTGGRMSSGRTSKPPANRNPQGRVEDLPKSKKVGLFTAMGRLFPPKAELIKSIFDEANAGFQVQVKEATIANLKAVSDDAVFYIHAHGGAGQLHKKEGPNSIMALWTTDLVTAGTEVTYKTELDEERMCYMFASYHTQATELHYAITSSFVREYMSFGENCFIYLQACNGFNESVQGNATFRERMIANATNQKATFVGWTGVQNDVMSGMFVFDRLLGANSGGQISQENPFQRPFDIAQVFADMQNEGLGVSMGVQLKYKTTLEQEVLLRPTIESVEVDEYTSRLIIYGLFPSDKGHVGVNNVSVAVDSWSPYGITCIIPETGDGSVGDVVVISAQGVKSNAVPLTEYIIKLNYSSDDNGIKFAGVADLRIRADVHRRRSKIGETPTKPTYPDLSPSSGFLFNVKGSSATYSLTGRHYDACNIGPCNYQFTGSPTPKAGTLPYTLATQGSVPFFAMYNWGPEMKSIKISYINANVTGIPLVFQERVQCPNIPVTDIPVEMPYDAWFGFPTHELDGSFTIEIAENFNMRPGSWTKSINRPSPCSLTGAFKQTVTWDVVVPKHAPTEETSARMANSDGE
ncbi:MAG TPA: hypothetical protein VK589_03770 [Chryseolinea sp.]|nr:hypothetical protein [Chryseolinea sp.]